MRCWASAFWPPSTPPERPTSDASIRWESTRTTVHRNHGRRGAEEGRPGGRPRPRQRHGWYGRLIALPCAISPCRDPGYPTGWPSLACAAPERVQSCLLGTHRSPALCGASACRGPWFRIEFAIGGSKNLASVAPQKNDLLLCLQRPYSPGLADRHRECRDVSDRLAYLRLSCIQAKFAPILHAAFNMDAAASHTLASLA